jgi:hypothetical protein
VCVQATRQPRVGLVHSAYPSQPHGFAQAVLQGLEQALKPALGLWAQMDSMPN